MSAFAQLTYAGVLIAVFANQLCLPIPAVVFLMAAGALAAHGRMQFSVIMVLATTGCLAADGIWFCFGRRWGSQAMRLLCRLSRDPRESSRNAHRKFQRYGLPILCFAKFLPGLDGILPPLAGAEGVSVTSFLALDTLGSSLWAGFYTGLGHLFSSQLDIAIRWVQHFGTILGIAVVLPVTLYAGLRALGLIRMMRRLRLRRISPPMLLRKLKSNKKVAVLDLLNFEAESEDEPVEGIPGACRIDPSRLRRSPHISVPGDVDVVLYSSSGGDVISARAAMALKEVGIADVWVLEGGFKKWREKGFPVSKSLEPPEVVAGRLGVKLPEA